MNFLAACALTVFAGVAQASEPRIALTIEQPVYAGLPVWLDVDVDAPCIGAHYSGDLAGSVTGGWAEVTGPGTTQKPIFQPFPYPHSNIAIVNGGCPSRGPIDEGGTHRIPLHLVANLRTPGRYAVRWLVPKTTQLGDIKPTDWVNFVVQPSTSAQREAWLTALVAHSPVDANEVTETYVPSLLAAFDEPKAMHRLLGLLCVPDRLESDSVIFVFGPALPQDAQIYLAKLITQGCLTEALAGYIDDNSARIPGIFPGMPEQQELRLLKATIAALPNAKGANLAHAINIVSRLKNTQHGALAKAADAAVFSAAPKILADADNEPGSDDQPQWMLIEYADGARPTHAGEAFLRAVAAQNNQAAGYAITKLIYRRDPSEIPFLRNRLMQWMPRPNSPDPTRDFIIIPKFFGQPGTILLLSLLHARSPHVRTAAAMTLASQGERAGMQAIIEALQGNSVEDQIEILNAVIGTEAYPSGQHNQNRAVAGNEDLNAPWATDRKTAVIRYFQDKLANNTGASSP